MALKVQKVSPDDFLISSGDTFYFLAQNTSWSIAWRCKSNHNPHTLKNDSPMLAQYTHFFFATQLRSVFLIGDFLAANSLKQMVNDDCMRGAV